LRSTC